MESLCEIAASVAERCLGMPGVQLITPALLNHVVLRFGDSDQARGRVEVRATQWCNGSVMWISVRDDQLDAQRICDEIMLGWIAVQLRMRRLLPASTQDKPR
jgi:hypothetical protein